ncbi:MAG: YbaK/EbsC family protein [Eubacterium sp.]|nr:YbaK/EbsC family protein [Eubacterium sp.]
MSFEKAKEYLQNMGFADRIIVTEEETPTVALAALALGIEEGSVAKSLTFQNGERPILVLAEGTARIDNHKFKETFHVKARMIPYDEVEENIGHAPGGVCPFGIREKVQVYCDISLRKYPYVYPAAGDDHSGVKLTPEELFVCSEAIGWVDVCK